MSIHYILDGYNIIKQVNHLTGVRLRNDRQGLLWFLLEKRPTGSPRNRVTVVFDGRDDPEKATAGRPIHVVFSNDRSADDVIVDMVRKSKNPRRLVVVTDDRELRLRAEDLGASVASVPDFLAQAIQKRPAVRKGGSDKPDPESLFGRTLIDELEKEWIDDEQDP